MGSGSDLSVADSIPVACCSVTVWAPVLFNRRDTFQEGVVGVDWLYPISDLIDNCYSLLCSRTQ